MISPHIITILKKSTPPATDFELKLPCLPGFFVADWNRPAAPKLNPFTDENLRTVPVKRDVSYHLTGAALEKTEMRRCETETGALGTHSDTVRHCATLLRPRETFPRRAQRLSTGNSPRAPRPREEPLRGLLGSRREVVPGGLRMRGRRDFE